MTTFLAHESKKRSFILASQSVGRRLLFANDGIKVELCTSNFPEDLDKSLSPYEYVCRTSQGKAIDIITNQKTPFIHDLLLTGDTMMVFNLDKFSFSNKDLINTYNNQQYQIIGKPNDSEDAFNILSLMSGHKNHVITGVSIILPLYIAIESQNKNKTLDQQYIEYIQARLLESLKLYRQNNEPKHLESWPDDFFSVSIVKKEDNFQYFMITFSAQSIVCFHSLTDGQIHEYISTGECYGKAGAFAIQGIGKALVDHIEGSLDNIVGFPIQQLNFILQHILEDNHIQWINISK